MANPLESWIPGLDPLTGTVTLPLWVAGAAAALFVVFCAMALSRAGREGIAGGVARFALVLIGAVLAWFFLDGTTRQDTAAERRALEARAGALATRATMPGSPLACLDAMAGDAVERSCERTLFSTPEAVASAVSYVTARLSLFADVSEFVNRGNSDLEPLLASLRRAVEADHYGLVAHVLTTRDGCTVEKCPALAMMRDPTRLNINLTQRTYEFYVARHALAWPAAAAGPTASAAPPAIPGAADAQPTQAAAGSPATQRPNGELFFPTSETIPPVNIMTAEPGVPSETTGSAPARTPPRRPAQRDQQPKQQAQPKQKAPVELNATARGGAPPAE